MKFSIVVEENKTCTVLADTGDVFLNPHRIENLTPEQATELKRALESMYRLGKRSGLLEAQNAINDVSRKLDDMVLP